MLLPEDVRGLGGTCSFLGGGGADVGRKPDAIMSHAPLPASGPGMEGSTERGLHGCTLKILVCEMYDFWCTQLSIGPIATLAA